MMTYTTSIDSIGLKIDYANLYTNDAPTTDIYTLSLHDALPISGVRPGTGRPGHQRVPVPRGRERADRAQDRKSTRLNSSHSSISYSVFCWNNKNAHCLC